MSEPLKPEPRSVLKSTYPHLFQGRVDSLSHDPAFQAQRSLVALAEIVNQEYLGSAEDLFAIARLVRTIFDPAYSALGNAVRDSGYSDAEIDAASQISDGVMTLK